MVRHLLKQSIIGSLLALLANSCANQPIPPSTSELPTTTDAKKTIVIADISDEPTKQIEKYQPFADHLAAQLNTTGVGAGKVEIAPDMPTVAAWLASGKVDVYFDSPYPSLIVSNLSGAEPLLRRWKDGVSAYHSVIFTRADSDAKTIHDLQGHMIAFEEPFSTSGYMLPLAYLIESGLQPVEKTDAKTQVAKDKVGYVFSTDNENSIHWVLTGQVTAAAIGWPDFTELPIEARQQLTVLAETEALPRHLVLFSPTLSDEEVAALETALLEMDETAEGQAVLQAFEATTQFDAFPEGKDQALARMRELYNFVQAENQ
ncbi:MAG: phosphate/phosphite/phosphonate ABC transporter substrate-binding protein [Cyanobacteria bacterium P01_F01_bin.86]